MKARTLGIVVLVVVATAAIHAKGKTFVYEASRDAVFAAAMAIVAEEWTLASADKDTGMVAFRAGTQDGSVLVVAVSDTKAQVTVNTKTARAGLSIGLGIDGKKLQKKLVAALDKRLGVAGVELK